jgi:hypothetical protein
VIGCADDCDAKPARKSGGGGISLRIDRPPADARRSAVFGRRGSRAIPIRYRGLGTAVAGALLVGLLSAAVLRGIAATPALTPNSRRKSISTASTS